MRLLSLASGSTGNCYYVQGQEGGLLVDAGISCRQIVLGLEKVPGALANLQGILLTHEHSDHVAGVAVMMKKYQLPVYASQGTWTGIFARYDNIPRELAHVLPEGGFSLGSLDVCWFDTSHDAREPVSYVVAEKQKRVGILTDTGCLTDQMLSALDNASIIALEANHDPDLLAQGSYPYHLKRRITSDQGHLSNADCAQGLQEIIGAQTKHVVLAHLSQENNRPALAFEAIKGRLKNSRSTGRIGLWVAQPRLPSINIEC